MGVSSITNRISYVGDGTSTIFSFPYYFFSPSDLKVYLYNIASSVVQPQTLNTNYTISGSVNAQGLYPSGGNVVMTSSIPSTHEIVITRDPSALQNYTLYQNQAINSVATVQQLDYLTLLVQRLQEQVARSVKMPDGLGPANGSSFSPELPNSISLTSMAGAALVLNSGATGITLTTVAVGQSGAIVYGGILPVQFGGTGQGQPLNPPGVVYAASSSQMNVVGPVGSNFVLQSNGSSAPSWIAFSALLSSSNIVSRDVNGNSYTNSFQNAGQVVPTGGSSIFTAASPSATVFTGSSIHDVFLPNATTLQPGWLYWYSNNASQNVTIKTGSGLITVATLIPGAAAEVSCLSIGTVQGSWDTKFLLPSNAQYGYNGLNLAIGSSVVNSLPIVNGGCAGSSALQNFMNISPGTTRGDLIVVQSSGISVRLPIGTDGSVLTANSSGINGLSWATPAGTVTTQTKTANYVMTAADDVIFVSSSLFNVQLPDATIGVNKKVYRIVKTDTSVNQAVTITCSGSQTVGGFTTRTLFTQNESWEIVPDGANHQILNHKAETPWTAYTAVIGCTTSNAPVVSSASSINAKYKRVGDMAKILFTYTGSSATGASNGSGSYLWCTPAGIIIDSSVVTTFPSTVNGETYGIVGKAAAYNVSPTTAGGGMRVYDASSLVMHLTNTALNFNQVGSGLFPIATNTTVYSFEATIPVRSWLA